MTIFDALILGIVEGFTEFLPISSTAHLVMASRLLEIPGGAFLSSFIIAIQLGAIASVVSLYWKKLFLNPEMFKRVAIAFVPTGIIGFLLYKLLKTYLIENLTLIACALLIGGVVLVVFEYFHSPSTNFEHNLFPDDNRPSRSWYAMFRNKWRPKLVLGRRETAEVIPEGPMPYATAFWIGCAQSLAIIPGVSRAGATILGGLMLGISREKIVEFSFLLAVPTMLAATGYDLLKTGPTFTIGEWESLAIGFFISFLAAYTSVKFLIRYVQTHDFSLFGWYRIVLGIVLLVWTGS